MPALKNTFTKRESAFEKWERTFIKREAPLPDGKRLKQECREKESLINLTSSVSEQSVSLFYF
jgi:hypothetical protein